MISENPVQPQSLALLLAAGRARRFGRDKLAEPMAGRPLCQHAALAFAEDRGLGGVLVALGDMPPIMPNPIAALLATFDGIAVATTADVDPAADLEQTRALLA